MNSALYVTKRDGRQETIDLEKIHKVVDWATEGLDKLSVSWCELRAHLVFVITSSVLAAYTFIKGLLKYRDPLTAFHDPINAVCLKLYLAIPNNRSPPNRHFYY